MCGTILVDLVVWSGMKRIKATLLVFYAMSVIMVTLHVAHTCMLDVDAWFKHET